MSLHKQNPILQSLSEWFSSKFSCPEALGLFFTVLFGFLILEFFGRFLTPIIMSIVFAYLLVGPVRFLQRCHIPHIVSVLIVFFIFVGLFVAMVLVVLPSLWTQGYSLVSNIPQAFAQVQHWISAQQQLHPGLFPQDKVDQIMQSLQLQTTNFGKWLLSHSIASLPGVLQIIIYLIVVPLLLFFFLKDRRSLTNWARQYMPKHKGLVVKVWADFNNKMGAYVRGRCIEVVIVFIVLSIAYSWLGLPHPISFAGAFAIAQLVPILGGVVATIPILIVALFEWGFQPTFWIFFVIHFLVYALDGNVLVPLLFSEVMNLHPVVIIISVMVFAAIWGIWGAFFSIPLASLIDIILREWPKITDSGGMAKE